MKIHEILSKQVADVKSGVISAINNFLSVKNIENITFDNTCVYGTPNDQFSEVIEGYVVSEKKVFIDNETDGFYLPISDLEIDYLLFILEQIEEERYTIEE